MATTGTAITTAGSTTTTLSDDSQERPLTITTLSRGGTQTLYLSYNTAGQRLTYSVYQGSTRQRGEQDTYRADGHLGQVAVLSGTTGYTDTYLEEACVIQYCMMRTKSRSRSRPRGGGVGPG